MILEAKFKPHTLHLSILDKFTTVRLFGRKKRLNMFLVHIKLQLFKFSLYKFFIHFYSLFVFYKDYFKGQKIFIFCIFFK